MDERLFNFEKSITNLSNVANRIHRIKDNYKPETGTEHEDKKIGVISILNKDKNSVLDIYINRETISGRTKKYPPQILDKVLKNI